MRKRESHTQHDAIVETLISDHQLPIASFLRAILPGVGDVSDVLQETNIILWKKRADFVVGTNFKAWAFAVARYAAMDAQKAYKRNAWLVFDDEVLDKVEEEFTKERETVCSKHQALSQCLSKMRREDLNLLRHRYMSNVKLEVYAARVNRSVVALKVKLHKLRNKLRLCIEERLKSESEE